MNKIKIDYIDFWIDESNNTWSFNRYTENQALNASRNMINCGNCKNCENCINCLECKECKKLKNGYGLGVRDPNKFYQDLYFNN